LPEEARRLLARTAALLSFAGDEAALAALRAAEGTRMAGGAYAEAFALITAARMTGIAELSRVRQEVELARTLPARGSSPSTSSSRSTAAGGERIPSCQWRHVANGTPRYAAAWPGVCRRSA
jgi:hypothetical protein